MTGYFQPVINPSSRHKGEFDAKGDADRQAVALGLVRGIAEGATCIGIGMGCGRAHACAGKGYARIEIRQRGPTAMGFHHQRGRRLRGPIEGAAKGSQTLAIHQGRAIRRPDTGCKRPGGLNNLIVDLTTIRSIWPRQRTRIITNAERTRLRQGR